MKRHSQCLMSLLFRQVCEAQCWFVISLPLTIIGTWAINFQSRIDWDFIFNNISISSSSSSHQPLECSSITKLELIGSNLCSIMDGLHEFVGAFLWPTYAGTYTHKHWFDFSALNFSRKMVVILAIKWNSISDYNLYSIDVCVHWRRAEKIERNEHELINKQTTSRSSQFSKLTIHNVWLWVPFEKSMERFSFAFFALIKCISLQLDISNICWFCMAAWLDGWVDEWIACQNGPKPANMYIFVFWTQNQCQPFKYVRT